MAACPIGPRALALLLAALSAGAAVPLGAQMQGTAPTDAGPAPYWRFLRHDPESLKQLGSGDLTAGLNRLGEVGFEIFIVTSASDQGAAGWLYLRQPPWTSPLERPRREYRVLDDAQIAQSGQGSYADGLAGLERDGWQLVAITTTKGGGAGWTFFLRERPAADPAASPVPAAGTPPTPSAPPAAAPPVSIPAADFSTPRAAVQTLIDAAAARDVERLSRCFAETAEEEFTPLRTRTASVRDLDALADLFQGANITQDKVKAGRTATVTVKLKTRDEDIDLILTRDLWQVTGF